MFRTRILLSLLLAWLPLFSTQAAPAGTQDTDDTMCAGPQRLAVSAAKHLLFQRRLERGEIAVPTKAMQIYPAGKVVVFEDDGRLVAAPESFDLSEKGLQFLLRETGYKTVRSARPLFAAIGDRIELGAHDSVEVELPGWEFPFFGESYTHVYVNSDGNLTLGSPSSWLPGYVDRDLGALLDGPPRIAPLYTFLDPSQTEGETGVFVKVFNTRLRVTWVGVPEWSRDNQNTFQVTIFRSGRIQMLYGDVDAEVAVVGISPGGGETTLELLDLDVDPPYRIVPGAIAESFSFQHEYDELGLANMFYEHYRDVYDFIIVYLDFPHALLGGRAGAYYLALQNTDFGIGRGLYDFSDLAGSGGKLQGVAHMGAMDFYPDDPDEIFGPILTPMTILAHEVGHRWLARVRFRDRDGRPSNGLCDTFIPTHWRFQHDTQGSVMFGNYIRDNGDGTFTTYDGPRLYSDLDLYLMGMLPPEQVRDFFYVENDFPPTWAPPHPGYTMSGERVDVDVWNVIAAEGARNPSAAEAQKHFNMAFVLLTAHGQAPRRESLTRLQRIVRRWMTFFPEATRGAGSVATRIHPR